MPGESEQRERSTILAGGSPHLKMYYYGIINCALLFFFLLIGNDIYRLLGEEGETVWSASAALPNTLYCFNFFELFVFNYLIKGI